VSASDRAKSRVEGHPIAIPLLVLGAAGALPGTAVTAFVWLVLIHPSVLWPAFLFMAVGSVVGAIIGIVVGSGLVKEVWEGPLHALLITTPLIALLNVIFLFLLFTTSGGD
jgi:hypothetical protein